MISLSMKMLQNTLPKIAIIGRPNVGKSTLFNMFTGKKCAIVSEISGMTRDRNIQSGKLFDLQFDVIDTAGVVPHATDQISLAMNAQSYTAIEEAELILFIVDAKSNNLNAEERVAEWIRQVFKTLKKNKPIILIANKSDAVKYENYELSSLGFGEAIYLSAAHKIGLDDLYNQLQEYMPQVSELSSQNDTNIKVAILGRPNVGKSTLVNCILGENRLITSDISGTTRDSISVKFKYKQNIIEFVDTAGSRKNKKANSEEEVLSLKHTKVAVESANIVVLVIDSQFPFDTRDLQLINYVIEQGRGLIIVINKCDLIKKALIKNFLKECIQKIGKQISESYEVIAISAITGENIKQLLSTILSVYTTWNKVITTNKLNRWLAEAVTVFPPSTIDKKCPKLSFIKQVSSRPPSFLITGTKIDLLEKHYEKYLENNIRKKFDLYSTPLRLAFKYKKNPFKNSN